MQASDLFDIDDVGIARLSVGCSSRDDDAVALFCEAEFHGSAFGVVEEDVDRVKLFGQNGNHTPGEVELAVRLRFDGHADNVDLRAESGNETGSASRT